MREVERQQKPIQVNAILASMSTQNVPLPPLKRYYTPTSISSTTSSSNSRPLARATTSTASTSTRPCIHEATPTSSNSFGQIPHPTYGKCYRQSTCPTHTLSGCCAVRTDPLTQTTMTRNLRTQHSKTSTPASSMKATVSATIKSVTMALPCGSRQT